LQFGTRRWHIYPLTPTAAGLPDPGIFFFTWFVLAAVHLVMVVVKDSNLRPTD
jgi:hypothetical protein